MNYDIDYYENLLRRYSRTAEEICRIRWDWIAELNPKSVLDYGSGVGWFRAYRPKGVVCHSYDIGPYPQTGMKAQVYDVVCFFDVLEHIPDFGIIEPVMRLANNVATSLPIRNGDLAGWMHFKPGEHLHYFTEEMLSAFMAEYGFVMAKKGAPECPPRKDIKSYIFKRRE